MIHAESILWITANAATSAPALDPGRTAEIAANLMTIGAHWSYGKSQFPSDRQKSRQNAHGQISKSIGL